MKKRIGELLTEAGACSENDVREALGHQRAWASNQKLGEVLVSVGKVTPTAVARALSVQFDLPFVTLPQIPEKVSKTVPLSYQEEHRIVPFRLEVEGKSERLHIAVADPSNLELVDELRFELRKTVRVYVAATDDIGQAIATMKGESLEEIQPIEVSDEDEETPLQIERGAQTGAPGGFFAPDKPGPVPELPDEWSLGPPPVAPEPAADLPWPPAPEKPPAVAPAVPLEPQKPPVNAELAALFDEEPEAQATEEDSGLPTIDLSTDDADDAPPEPATEPPPAVSEKPAPVEDPHPFAAVLDADTDDSWGAALLPGGSGTAPSTTNSRGVPSVSAPPTQPPQTESSSPAAAAVEKQSLTPQVPPVEKSSTAATNSVAVSPNATPPPQGAVINQALASSTGAPASEPESPSAKGATKSEAPAGQEKLDFNDEDLKILEDIERLADGEPAPSGSLKVQPAQMVASLIRLLIKKGVINELEFLDELSRK